MQNFHLYMKFKISILVEFYDASLQFSESRDVCGHLGIKEVRRRQRSQNFQIFQIINNMVSILFVYLHLMLGMILVH